MQGEALQTTLPSEREYGEYFIAQCYYQLPTITNSVVVNVTTPKERGKSVKEFWRSTHAEAGSGKEPGQKESRPEKISGVGEDAYWEASGIAGALYVLKRDVIFRISVGGASDIKTKLESQRRSRRKHSRDFRLPVFLSPALQRWVGSFEINFRPALAGN